MAESGVQAACTAVITAFWRLGVPLLLAVQGTALAQQLPAFSQGYDPERDPFADGREALRIARATQRLVLVEVGGDWCRWCHVLDRFLEQHEPLRRRLHATFVLLKVNVDERNDNAAFLSAFPAALGYPHMYITAADGSILHSQDTAEFLQDGRYSAARFRRFLDRWSSRHE